MPLPLISARPPSALYSAIVTSASVAAVTWSRPSAPTPRCRSHTARANDGVTGVTPSRSSKTRKSLPRPWCLVRCMRRSSLPADDPFQCRQYLQRVAFGVEPLDSGVSPEPRPLATGELAGTTDRGIDGVVEVTPLRHVLEQFAVAESLRGGARQPIGARREAPDLVDEASVDLLAIALDDPGADDLGGQDDADEPES